MKTKNAQLAYKRQQPLALIVDDEPEICKAIADEV